MNSIDQINKILIIDDTVSIINMVKTALLSDDYKILMATSGKKGIHSAIKAKPDLILLDILMPEMDGYETCKQLKAHPETKQIPVIFMSALTEVFDKVKAFNLGAVDYITKPVNIEELRARVKTQVSLYKMQQKLSDTNAWLEQEVEKRTIELRKSHEKYQTVAEYTSDWEYWILPNGSIEFMSPSCKRITGYSIDEFVSNPNLIQDIIHQDDHGKWQAHLKNNSGHIEHDEEISFKIITKSNKEVWIGHICSRVYDTEGNDNGIRISNRDITSSKLAEIAIVNKNQELQAAEEELQATNEALRDNFDRLNKSEHLLKESQRVGKVASWEYDFLTDTLYWSDEIYRMIGFEPRSFEPSLETYSQYVHPEDRKRVEHTYNSSVESKSKIYEVEHRFIQENTKKELVVREIGHNSYDEKGEPIRTVGMTIDITDQKKAEMYLQEKNEELATSEEAIKKSEELFSSTLKNLLVGVVVHAADTSIIMSNVCAQSILGLSNDQLLGKKAIHKEWKFIGQDNLPLKAEDYPVNKTIALNEGLVNYTIGINKPNRKEIVWVNVNTVPVFAENKVLDRVIVNFMDITLRINAEMETEKAIKELNHERDLLHALMHNIPDRIYFKDTQSKFIRINKAKAVLLGIDDPDIVIGKTDFDFHKGVHAEEAYRDEQHIISTKEAIVNKIDKNVQPNGKVRWASSTKVPIINSNKQITGIVGVTRDITEEKEAEQQVIENEERYRNIQENMRSGVAIFRAEKEGSDFIFISFNKAAEKITSIKEKNIVGKSFLEIYPNTESQPLFKGLQEVYSTGQYKYLEPFYFTNTKIPRWRDNRIYKLSNGEVVTIFNDVTEKVESEKKLRQSEEKFRTLANNTPGVIYLCNNDSGYTMTYLNQSVKKLTGYRAEEFYSKTISFVDLFHPNDLLRIKDTVSSALESKKPFHLTYQIKTKKGEWRWIEEHGAGVFENDKLQFIEGSLMDITQRKNNELIDQGRLNITNYAATHNLHELLEYIIEQAKNITQSKNGFYHIVNSQSGADVTSSEEPFKPQSILDNGLGNLHEYPHLNSSAWLDCFKYKQSIICNQCEKENNSNSSNRELLVPVLRNNNVGAIIGVSNKADDYTKTDVKLIEQLADIAHETITRKHSEKLLLENEKQLQIIFDNSPAIMFLVNQDAKIVKMNKTGVEFLNLTMDEIYNNKAGDAFSCIVALQENKGCGKGYACNSCIIQSLLNDVINTKVLQNKVETKLNIVRDERIQAFYVLVSSNVATVEPENTYLITIDDITERKTAEIELQQSEERFNAFMENTPVYAYIKDAQLNHVYSNRHISKLFGMEEADNFSDKDIFSVETTKMIEETDKQILKQEHNVNVLEYETEIDGEMRWLRDVKFPIRMPNNNVYVGGVASDITENKKNELALKASETRFRAIIEAANDAIFIAEADTAIIVDVNKKGQELLGKTKNEIIGMHQVDMHPKDEMLQSKASFKEDVNAAGKPIVREITILHSAGYIIPVEVSPALIKLDDGKEYLVGFFRDITQRKIAEHALEESMDRFKQLADTANEGIILHKNGIIVDANKSSLGMSNYTLPELIGKNVIDVFIPKRYQKMVLEGMKHNNPPAYEIEALRKDGSLLPVEVKARNISKQNKIMRVISIRDITQQKQVQHKVLQAIINTEENERRRVAQELHDGLGPILSTVKLYTETYLKSDNEEFKEKIKTQLMIGINESLVQVASISNNLSPHVLDDFGIKAAIEKFIDKLTNIHEVDFEFKFLIAKVIKKDIETTLYRVCIELINNSMKHANASLVKINFFEENENIILIYNDNGKGFDFNIVKEAKRGMGLFNIVNRIKSLNGRVDFARKKKGIEYRVEIPL